MNLKWTLTILSMVAALPSFAQVVPTSASTPVPTLAAATPAPTSAAATPAATPAPSPVAKVEAPAVQPAQIASDYEKILNKLKELSCVSIIRDPEASKITPESRSAPFAKYINAETGAATAENKLSEEAQASEKELLLNADLCRQRYAKSVLLTLSVDDAADEVAQLIFDSIHGDSYETLMQDIAETYAQASYIIFPQKPEVIWVPLQKMLFSLQIKMTNELTAKKLRSDNPYQFFIASNFVRWSKFLYIASGVAYGTRMVVGGMSAGLRRLPNAQTRNGLWINSPFFKKRVEAHWERLAAKAKAKNSSNTATGENLLTGGDRIFLPDGLDVVARAATRTSQGFFVAGLSWGLIAAIYKTKVARFRSDPVTEVLADTQRAQMTAYFKALKYVYGPKLEATYKKLAQNSYSVQPIENLQALYEEWMQNKADLELGDKFLSYFIPTSNEGNYKLFLSDAEMQEQGIAANLLSEYTLKTNNILDAIRNGFEKQNVVAMTATEANQAAAEIAQAQAEREKAALAAKQKIEETKVLPVLDINVRRQNSKDALNGLPIKSAKTTLSPAKPVVLPAAAAATKDPAVKKPAPSANTAAMIDTLKSEIAELEAENKTLDPTDKIDKVDIDDNNAKIQEMQKELKSLSEEESKVSSPEASTAPLGPSVAAAASDPAGQASASATAASAAASSVASATPTAIAQPAIATSTPATLAPGTLAPGTPAPGTAAPATPAPGTPSPGATSPAPKTPKVATAAKTPPPALASPAVAASTTAAPTPAVATPADAKAKELENSLAIPDMEGWSWKKLPPKKPEVQKGFWEKLGDSGKDKSMRFYNWGKDVITHPFQ